MGRVVGRDGGAVVGKLRAGKLIDFPGASCAADSGSAATHGYDRRAVCTFDDGAGVGGDGPGRPFAGFVGGGFAAGVGDVDGRASGEIRDGVEIAIIEHQNFVRSGGRAERCAYEDTALFGVNRDPQRLAVLPIDLVPGGLNFLRNFDWFAAAEKVKAGAVRDDHPVFSDAYAAHGGRADSVRDFRDRPQRRLVGAVVLRDVQGMFFYEIEAFAQGEGG